MKQHTQNTDVLIVGAGPVGLFTAFQCGMLGLSSHIVDILEAPGGQCTMLYPEKPIYDIPGFPKVTADELIERLLSQANAFDPVWHLGSFAEGLRQDGCGRLQVELSDGRVVDAGAVVIAAGAGAFAPNRPDLADIGAYEGHSVFYSVRSREELRGKRVVIGGGGDSAVDWALLLSEIGASVTLVHRRDRFRAAPDSLQKLRAAVDEGRITLCIPCQLSGLDGDPESGRLKRVRVSTLDGETRALPADVLLPFYGLSPDLGPIAHWGINLARNQVIVNPLTGETSVEGVFAVGDVAIYPHKLKLILTGFAEAAQAAYAIRARLRPQEASRFEHSTNKAMPPVHTEFSANFQGEVRI